MQAPIDRHGPPDGRFTRQVGTILLFQEPMQTKARNEARSSGMRWRRTSMTAIRIRAAKPMRQAAVVKVGSSFTMIACMKKEPHPTGRTE